MNSANHLTWIITRPQEDAEKWVGQLRQMGYQAMALPCLRICPIFAADLPLKGVTQLEQSDHIILTSPNSVRCCPRNALAVLQQQSQKLISMGQGTTRALQIEQIAPGFTAAPGMTSETLLSHRLLAAEKVQHQRIVILGGEEGRDVLQSVLKERGSDVTKLAVYKRSAPPLFDPTILHTLKNIQPLWVITSQSALENLLTLYPKQELPLLRSQALMVVSQRIQDFARQHGFVTIWNANSTRLSDLVAHLNNQVV